MARDILTQWRIFATAPSFRQRKTLAPLAVRMDSSQIGRKVHLQTSRVPIALSSSQKTMAEPLEVHRRQILHAALAGAGLAAMAAPSLAASARPAGGEAAVIAAARTGLQHAAGQVAHTDLVGVADFSEASKIPRFHLVDIAGGRIDSLLVAHGRGSDPGHTGWVKTFSNAPGSEATSEGCYLTADQYVGGHGRSIRLKGLDPTNSNAEARAIVIHSAWYVGPDMVRAHGILGRSEGCLAVSQADLPQVLQRLGPGRLIVARKL